MVTELLAGSAKLRLHTDDHQWCQISLDIGELRLLGAESFPVVVERLLQSLRADVYGLESGTIDGVGVVWVMSLSEHHATIYAAQRDGIRVLYFQDADGKLIGRLELSGEQRQRWVSLLEAASANVLRNPV